MRSIGETALNRLAKGIAVCLIAYLLILQGLVTAYARTLMATDQFYPAFVICAPSGQKDSAKGDPLEHAAKECCVALCKTACAAGPSLEPSPADLSAFLPIAKEDKVSRHASQQGPPGEPGALQDARAPPSFSI